MPRKLALAAAPAKVNPRISVKWGWREAGVSTIPLFREIFEEFLPRFEEVYKEEGAVTPISQAHRVLGSKAFHQSNFGEYLSLKAQEKDIGKPKTEELFEEFISRIKKEKPADYIPKTPIRVFKTPLSSRFRPTRDKGKVQFELTSVVDKNGYIVLEIVLTPRENLKKGTALLQRAAKEDPVSKVSKPTTWKGERGYWVTLNNGRKIFIPEKYQKQYHNWKAVEGVGAFAAVMGTLSLFTTTGIMSVPILTAGLTKVASLAVKDPAKKAALKSIQSAIKKIAEKTTLKVAAISAIGVVGGFLTHIIARAIQRGMRLWAANARAAARIPKKER